MPNEKWLVSLAVLPALLVLLLMLVTTLIYRPQPRKYLKCHTCGSDLLLFPAGCLAPDRSICQTCGGQYPAKKMDRTEAEAAQAAGDANRGFIWAPRGDRCYSCGACDPSECAKDRFQLTIVPKGSNEPKQS